MFSNRVSVMLHSGLVSSVGHPAGCQTESLPETFLDSVFTFTAFGFPLDTPDSTHRIQTYYLFISNSPRCARTWEWLSPSVPVMDKRPVQVYLSPHTVTHMDWTLMTLVTQT